MKLLLLILAATFTTVLTGCTASSPIKFADKHCKPSYEYNPETGITTATYNCYGLFEWRKAKEYVKSAEVCIDPVNGAVTGQVTYDSTSKISKLYGKK